MLDYLVSAFRKPDPYTDGHEVKVVSILEQIEQELEQQLIDDPLERATLLDAIGRTYGSLGIYEREVACAEKVLKIREMVLPADDADILDAMHGLAVGGTG